MSLKVEVSCQSNKKKLYPVHDNVFSDLFILNHFETFFHASLTLFGPGYFGVGKDRGADSARPPPPPNIS